ncbi:transcriptional regulator [Litorimonas cladophorae]|uniref:Transcriptional regulator n=1 Tax=Litorimonas cladophorae TaxID=1220491 RepID=A0A918NIG9_9PROT|nr:FMN-binding negative transcriptional regulator [Litorimonas cladophorae]GGX75567.1 transcriptional regulator [Litorimonas cladophorae]
MSYPPPHYVDNDTEYTNRIIDTYGFPLLTSSNVEGPLATHLPMVRDGEYLYGHIAANNPMAEFLGTSMVFLAAFHGPHDYISATLYDKPEKSVPTWDYTAVHVHGVTTVLNPEKSVDRMVELTEKYEGPDGWAMEDAASYASRLFPHIVYFEMRMDRVRGIRKLSQNKNAATQARIIKDLRAKGIDGLADEIDLIRKS